MLGQYFAEMLTELVDGRQRLDVGSGKRGKPRRENGHINRENATIATNQLCQPELLWPCSHEINRQSRRARPQRCNPRLRVMTMRQLCCQPCDRWAQEKCRNTDMTRQRLIDFANNPECQERVAAQIKEIVGAADPLHPQKVAPNRRKRC